MSLAGALWIAGVAAMAWIRAPHIRRSLGEAVATSRRSRRDDLLVAFVSTGLVLPTAWLISPALAFADRPTMRSVLCAGVACLGLGLELLRRSHRDLGRCWSNTLELRARHRLVTSGVYRHVRHPMYAALLLFGIGQALVLPNWIAGPSFLVAFAVLVLRRHAVEEAMMKGAFGAAYEAYAARTARLVPGIW